MNCESCTNCGKCTRNCDFLNKYKINLAEFAERPDLAYHCFLCGDCAESCPQNIDGRKIALDLRFDKSEIALKSKEYKMLILEKKKYVFQNYKNAASKSLLFPGCNFPSFYPETTKKLVCLLKEKAGIGVAFDCCGKPIFELGLEEDYKKIIAAISKKMHESNVEELIALCPNCYYFLKENLDIKVVSIYEKLWQLGLGNIISDEKLDIFVPCPDKKTGEIKQSFMPFIKGNPEEIKGIQCCGLGGCAAPYEAEIAKEFSLKIKAKNLPAIHTYCASCAGNLSRSGCNNVRHILVDLLCTNESASRGYGSLINRAKFKFF